MTRAKYPGGNSYWHALKPTFEEIKTYLSYNPKTGVFVWLKMASKKIVVGNEAGSLRPDGYIQIRYGKKTYFAQHLAWWWVHGEFVTKPEIIDHINRKRADNRIKNLRRASQSINMMNRGPKVNGTCKFKGVTRLNDGRGWQAHIRYKGKSYNLGAYMNQKKAAQAYDAKAIEMFGQYAKLNFPRKSLMAAP